MSDAGSFKVNTIRRKIAIDMGFLLIYTYYQRNWKGEEGCFLSRKT